MSLYGSFQVQHPGESDFGVDPRMSPHLPDTSGSRPPTRSRKRRRGDDEQEDISTGHTAATKRTRNSRRKTDRQPSVDDAAQYEQEMPQGRAADNGRITLPQLPSTHFQRVDMQQQRQQPQPAAFVLPGAFASESVPYGGNGFEPGYTSMPGSQMPGLPFSTPPPNQQYPGNPYSDSFQSYLSQAGMPAVNHDGPGRSILSGTQSRVQRLRQDEVPSQASPAMRQVPLRSASTTPSNHARPPQHVPMHHPPALARSFSSPGGFSIPQSAQHNPQGQGRQPGVHTQMPPAHLVRPVYCALKNLLPPNLRLCCPAGHSQEQHWISTLHPLKPEVASRRPAPGVQRTFSAPDVNRGARFMPTGAGAGPSRLNPHVEQFSRARQPPRNFVPPMVQTPAVQAMFHEPQAPFDSIAHIEEVRSEAGSRLSPHAPTDDQLRLLPAAELATGPEAFHGLEEEDIRRWLAGPIAEGPAREQHQPLPDRAGADTMDGGAEVEVVQPGAAGTTCTNGHEDFGKPESGLGDLSYNKDEGEKLLPAHPSGASASDNQPSNGNDEDKTPQDHLTVHAIDAATAEFDYHHWSSASLQINQLDVFENLFNDDQTVSPDFAQTAGASSTAQLDFGQPLESFSGSLDFGSGTNSFFED
ncbi:hypothetical protein CPC08DRAFT_760235 [Agrocybe pediades]|nr:hypothetical protein CPC08DRAFT_760235 [Agrocybe pediades]